jgi:hypothetical protein
VVAEASHAKCLWDGMPHAWQEQAISHILLALAKDDLCVPLLLVPPMGGGKSAVRVDTVGVILASVVVLAISPLLSLAANRTECPELLAQCKHHFSTKCWLSFAFLLPGME